MEGATAFRITSNSIQSLELFTERPVIEELVLASLAQMYEMKQAISQAAVQNPTILEVGDVPEPQDTTHHHVSTCNEVADYGVLYVTVVLCERKQHKGAEAVEYVYGLAILLYRPIFAFFKLRH